MGNFFALAAVKAGNLATAAVKAVTTVVNVVAVETTTEETTTAATSININFDPTQMFTYSNVIIDCMMPVVYITAGLSLGFTVIYALKSAFSSRF